MLFAIASIAFGIIQLATGDFNRGLLPVPATVPGRMLLLYICATLLLILGTGLLVPEWRYKSAIWLGIFYCLLFLLVHLFPLISNVYNPNAWTASVEVISLSSGAFLIAAIGEPLKAKSSASNLPSTLFLRIGRCGFSFALLVFAFLHFKYAAFIATLIPAWIPFKLFLAIFIGIGFAAAAVSILLNKLIFPAMCVQGCMFLLWVFILHLPRAIAKMTEEPEWTSLFVALAFSGISFTLAFLVINKLRAEMRDPANNDFI